MNYHFLFFESILILLKPLIALVLALDVLGEVLLELVVAQGAIAVRVVLLRQKLKLIRCGVQVEPLERALELAVLQLAGAVKVHGSERRVQLLEIMFKLLGQLFQQLIRSQRFRLFSIEGVLVIHVFFVALLPRVTLKGACHGRAERAHEIAETEGARAGAVVGVHQCVLLVRTEGNVAVVQVLAELFQLDPVAVVLVYVFECLVGVGVLDQDYVGKQFLGLLQFFSCPPRAVVLPFSGRYP